jgi:hypothetical protein
VTIGNRIKQIIHKNCAHTGFGRRILPECLAGRAAGDVVCFAHHRILRDASPGIALSSLVIEFRAKKSILRRETASQRDPLI